MTNDAFFVGFVFTLRPPIVILTLLLVLSLAGQRTIQKAGCSNVMSVLDS